MPKPNQRNARISGQNNLELPPGVKLLRVLEGHNEFIRSVAFDPSGRMLASGGGDKTVKLWDIKSGNLLRTLEGHDGYALTLVFDNVNRRLFSGDHLGKIRLWDIDSGKLLYILNGKGSIHNIAFDPLGRMLASAGGKMIELWDIESGNLLRSHEGHNGSIYSLAFDPSGHVLASGSFDKTVKLWDVASGELLRTLNTQQFVWSVAFNSSGRILVSGEGDGVIRIWDVESGQLLNILEAHTARVESIAFSGDGRLLASKGVDGTLRLWNCDSWETVAVIPESANKAWVSNTAFHPTLPLLVSVGIRGEASEKGQSYLIHLWELDFNLLLEKGSEIAPAMQAVHHMTAKIVLVGDHSVGKSGLGWRLKHGEFKEQSSTHGQQFWVLPQLGKRRKDRTECEAILWDLAGQPDYRLIHALFLDDVDLALVLFDSSDISDPLHGVEFWLKQLKAGKTTWQSGAGEAQTNCPVILVGAQADRGTPRLTREELEEFCQQRGISGYISTSALNGLGLEELVERMKALIPWDEKAATVTTVTFKRIKDYVLNLKETRKEGDPVIVNLDELRGQLEQKDAGWRFTDAEMIKAVGHLENYGYVKRLRTSKGEERVLLAPELLNNLAASFVLEARRNPDGLGALEEKRLMEGGYAFSELERLSRDERDILLDSAALLFIEHNVCFREKDPLGGQSYLVFPELINMKKPPLEDEQPTEDGAAYSVSGAVENVYASLVVLLGYTQTFTRRNQWQNQARYLMADGSVCGFRQESSHEGALELVLYFGADVKQAGRKVFEGLFESFLGRRNVTVFRYEPVVCSNEHTINRSVVKERLKSGKGFAFCEECGEKALLPKADVPIQLTQTERRKVEEQRWFAEHRTRFEQAIYQVMSYVKDQSLSVPECFISYAWGDKEQERWVERSLATDLQKAGINVVLDRWENERVGASVSRFVERIEKADWVVVVGTPLYRKKYENKDTDTGYVVAAEVDVISNRLLGTEKQKEIVLPVLLAGEKAASFPALLHSRVHADFRVERRYFTTAFDLILDLYGIAHTDTAVADLRESLRDFEVR